MRGKPVILIGGANGAGKTALSGAVSLCFCGTSSVGMRVTKKAYERPLAKRIRRCRKGSTEDDHASTAVSHTRSPIGLR